jgi:dihydroxy-acid dehydratase
LRKAFIKGPGTATTPWTVRSFGIVDTESGFNPCHGNVPQLIKAIERGVHAGRRSTVPFPTISIHESFAYPTSMFIRT